MLPPDLRRKAQFLVQRLANESTQPSGTGSMSVAIYDTAWIAMISRDASSGTEFVFPESFQYLLDAQSQEGGWGAYATEVDGILNTAAALLALLKHQTVNSSVDSYSFDLKQRISRGRASLAVQLQDWDVEACDQVGFEILVPALLGMLGKHQIDFEFVGREKLMGLRDSKMSHIRIEVLYKPVQTTLLHSLEAFVGKIDFDKVSHHKTDGSMMASPSSTAAYLMNCSTWDTDAEKYLRSVVVNGVGKGNGSVPCAFPTTFFEISWVLTILLKAGFTKNELGYNNVRILSDLLRCEFEVRNGIVGFAPSLLADADDTANTILTLNLLGQPGNPEQMILNYETEASFQTYPRERNPSFSANCNILRALLHTVDPSRYVKQISKAAKFLCKAWNSGAVRDKWNLSPFYSMMLLAQTFHKLLQLWSDEQLLNLSTALVRDEIPIVLLQIVVRILYQQNPSGSWGSKSSCETTAYALLSLAAASPFPWCQMLSEVIESAIKAGNKFLHDSRDLRETSEYLWIEKVSYGSAILAEAYCLAANYAAINFPTQAQNQWPNKMIELIHLPVKAMVKFTEFFIRIPLFHSLPKWQLQASLLEGYMYLPKLREIRLNIFPREKMAEDKYLEYIPFTWTSCNSLRGRFQSPATLWTMMEISMLNYQVDEYMETVVSSHFNGDIETAREMIRRLFNSEISGTATKPSTSMVNGNGIHKNPCVENGIISNVEQTLARFIHHVLDHPGVQTASSSDRTNLRRELEAFLQAHLTQAEDNRAFANQDQGSEVLNFAKFERRYFEWVRTISATHTSCPYAFAFITCLASKNGNDCFPTAEQKYFAQDLCCHLATLCRQYNDYGSVARDKAEQNLNSINFLEFKKCFAHTKNSNPKDDENARKDTLFQIADYERKCMNLAFEELRKTMPKRLEGLFNVFVDVTDLYGQIYVARDIASRMF